MPNKWHFHAMSHERQQCNENLKVNFQIVENTFFGLFAVT